MRPIDLTNPVDWQHPLNGSLLSWWLPLPGRAGSNTLFDIARTNHGTLTNGPTWAAGPNGFGAVQFDGSNDYVDVGAGNWLTGDFTLSLLLNPAAWPTATGQYAGLFSKRSGFASMSFEVYYNNSADAVSQGTNKGIAWASGNSLSNGIIGFGVDPSLNTWSLFTLAKSGTTYTAYLNGVAQSTQTRAGTVPTGTNRVVIGTLGSELAGTSAYMYSGVIGSTLVHDGRPLSASEVATLYDQTRRGFPDLLRRVPTAKWFVGVSNSYSLAASAASYAITGTAAGLLHGRRIAADSASYAITGAAAGVLRGRRVGADSASYAITGANADFPRNRVVAANAASYAITGTAANLARSRIVGADAASYAITGTAANLLRGRRVGADAASYAVTGSNAALLYGRRLLSASASYVITGTAANLVKSGGYTLNADPASLAVTGTAAGVLHGRRIASNSAAYVLTGTAANLLRGRWVAADSAAYVITGANADFPRTRVLTATAGSYVITGTAATLARSRIMPATAGSYAITGTAANLLRGRRVAADSASYAITGTAATLRIARRLSASSAAYVLAGDEATLIYSGDPSGGFGAHLSKIPLRG